MAGYLLRGGQNRSVVLKHTAQLGFRLVNHLHMRQQASDFSQLIQQGNTKGR